MRIPLIYGSIIALAIFALVLVMYSTGYAGGEGSASNLNFLPVLIPIIGIYLGLRAQKNANDNALPYWEGLSTGAKISLVGAFLSSILFLVYYTAIDTASLDQVGRAYGMPNSSIALVMLVDVGIQFLSSLVFGVLVSLVMAIFLRT